MCVSWSYKYNKNQGHNVFLVYFFCNIGIYVLSESMAKAFILPSFSPIAIIPEDPWKTDCETIFLPKHYGFPGQWQEHQ